MYCSHCGNPLPEEIQAEEHIEETELLASADVKIAEINANRDIALAKIQAKIYTEELATDLAVAEAVTDVQEDVIDSLTPEPEIAEPVVIVDQAEPEPEADPTELPVADDSFTEPTESKKSLGLGVW